MVIHFAGVIDEQATLQCLRKLPISYQYVIKSQESLREHLHFLDAYTLSTEEAQHCRQLQKEQLRQAHNIVHAALGLK